MLLLFLFDKTSAPEVRAPEVRVPEVFFQTHSFLNERANIIIAFKNNFLAVTIKDFHCAPFDSKENAYAFLMNPSASPTIIDATFEDTSRKFCPSLMRFL